MKKNIVIGLLTVVTLLSMLDAYVKRLEINERIKLADECHKVAQSNYDELHKQRIVAEELAKRLEEQTQLMESNSRKTK